MDITLNLRKKVLGIAVVLAILAIPAAPASRADDAPFTPLELPQDVTPGAFAQYIATLGAYSERDICRRDEKYNCIKKPDRSDRWRMFQWPRDVPLRLAFTDITGLVEHPYRGIDVRAPLVPLPKSLGADLQDSIVQQLQSFSAATGVAVELVGVDEAPNFIASFNFKGGLGRQFSVACPFKPTPSSLQLETFDPHFDDTLTGVLRAQSFPSPGVVCFDRGFRVRASRYNFGYDRYRQNPEQITEILVQTFGLWSKYYSNALGVLHESILKLGHRSSPVTADEPFSLVEAEWEFYRDSFDPFPWATPSQQEFRRSAVRSRPIFDWIRRAEPTRFYATALHYYYRAVAPGMDREDAIAALTAVIAADNRPQ